MLTLPQPASDQLFDLVCFTAHLGGSQRPQGSLGAVPADLLAVSLTRGRIFLPNNHSLLPQVVGKTQAS